MSIGIEHSMSETLFMLGQRYTLMQLLKEPILASSRCEELHMARRVYQEVPYEPPAYALRALKALEDAGYEAWIVGGWVRDALLGDPCHDVDITTSAVWEESERVLSEAGFKVHETGVEHGTITAVCEGDAIEVTTYRVEGTYTDHRHPDSVRFVRNVEDDLSRRDFTINAMAYHPTRGLLDPYDGRGDLVRGVVRAVGDPRERLAEDALRVLRAVRFACRMGFSVEEKTHQALVEMAPGLDDIAQERIGQEMCGILQTGRIGWALKYECEVICAAIPEVTDMRGFDQLSAWHAYDVLEHTIHVCNAVEAFTAGEASLRLRWAALLHDIGKPATLSIDEHGIGHFYGHPVLGYIMTERIMKRMGLPGDLVRGASALVHYHDHIIRPTKRSMRRTLAVLEEAFPGMAMPLAHELMDLKRADAVSKVPKCAWYAVELDEMDWLLTQEALNGTTIRVTDLAIGGSEVIETLGIEPGPMVGMVLSQLLQAVIDGEVENTREDLITEIMRSVQEYG